MGTPRFVLLTAAALLCALSAGAADPPAADPPASDPLPKGAKVKLGSEGLQFRSGGRVALLPDGKTLLLPDTNGFRRFDATTGAPLDKGGAVNSPLTGAPVVVSGDGKRALVVFGGSTTVRDSETNKPVQELKPPVNFFAAAAGDATASLSFDGKVLAQGLRGAFDKNGKDGLIVWDVGTKDVLFETELAQPGPPIPVLSPDGKLLAARSASTGIVRPGAPDTGRTVQVFDIAAKKELFQVKLTPGLAPGITAVAISPDGKTLATSFDDTTVLLWDLADITKPK